MISFGRWTVLAWGIFFANVFSQVPMNVAGPVKVWIEFKDKGPGVQKKISVTEFKIQKKFEDLPVYKPYVDSLRGLGAVVNVQLKWQNKISVMMDSAKIKQILSLSFVSQVSVFPRKAKASPTLPHLAVNWFRKGLAKSSSIQIDYGAGRALMESLHVDKVHDWILSQGQQPGQGVTIAVIDADFHLGAAFYDDLFAEHKIKDEWDFVDKKKESVDREFLDSHGAECLSLIGGNAPAILVGVAPAATFLLYRAEDDAHESFVEEDNVAAAIERAVDSGAQVISISLGYRYEFDSVPDLAFSEFNGRKRPASIAAVGAARRNVIVSVAMGNLSSDPAHIPNTPSLDSPADADSILGVGIADAKHRRCSYSCTGPTADGRVKPDVASLGLGGGCTVNVANTTKSGANLSQFAGTSFAAPVVAGIAAVLRQSKPELNAEGVRQALIKTADRALHPDSGLGYGVLNAWDALREIQQDAIPFEKKDEWISLYHGGDFSELSLPWEWGRPVPNLELVDMNGKAVGVNVRVTGTWLQIVPKRNLRTGVYFAHAW